MKWINISEKMPHVDEIIKYKGNLRGAEGRHMGNGFVELKNQAVDQFDEWKPKYPGYVTMKVPRFDGVRTEVKGQVKDNEFIGEYKHEGMTYGIQISLQFTEKQIK